MCKRHWMSLPRVMRTDIWNTYREGQCNDWQISHEYAVAAKAAVCFIANREGKIADTSVYDMLDPERYNEPVPNLKENVMSAEVRKTGLLKKIEQRVAKAHEAHKGDETKYGMVDLPAGIKGGIARLAMCKLTEYDEDKKNGAKKGDVYAVFRGIAISPEKHDGVAVKGQGVMLSIPLCDTHKTKDGVVVPTSFDEHWAEFLNELRKFDLNTAAIPHNIIESVLADLEKSKPLFRFSTRAWTPPASKAEPNPSPMTFVQYDGVISAQEAEVATALAPTSGFAAPEASSNGDGGNDASAGEAAAAEGDFDLEQCSKDAESGDMSAIDLMKDAARKVGITEDEIDNSSSWVSQGEGTSLYELIEAKAAEGAGAGVSPTEPEAPAWEPKVGATCNYQIKAGGKVHQVKIEKIDKKGGTADLLNIGDKKTRYLAVKLEKLSAA